MSGFAEAEEEEEWRLVEVVEEEEAQRRRPWMSFGFVLFLRQLFSLRCDVVWLVYSRGSDFPLSFYRAYVGCACQHLLIEISFRNCPIKDDDQAQVHDSTTRAQSGTKTSNFIHLLMGINLLMTS